MEERREYEVMILQPNLYQAELAKLSAEGWYIHSLCEAKGGMTVLVSKPAKL